MNRLEFIEYVQENFNVSVEFIRLLDNVLYYAEIQGFEDDELYSYLDLLLDDTIGLTQQEIKQIIL